MAEEGFRFLRGQKRDRVQAAKDPLAGGFERLTVASVDLGGELAYAGGRRKYTVEGLYIQTGFVRGIGGAALYLPRRERRVAMALAGRPAGELFILSSDGSAAQTETQSGQSTAGQEAGSGQRLLVHQLAIAGLIAAGIESAFDHDIGEGRAAKLFGQWAEYVDPAQMPSPPANLPYWASAVETDSVRGMA